MELTHQKTLGIMIVHARGKLIGGAEDAKTFHSLFQSLIHDGERMFVVDLVETPWASSQGIGMLISAYASVKRAGGQLVLANAVDRIKDVLTVTRLYLIFRVFHTVDEAIAHLTGRPAGGNGTAGHRGVKNMVSPGA
jgi:anti-anti-sigma factor